MKVTPWRYERKFAVEELEPFELIHALRVHPLLFREIYHERTIHNLYFDDENLTAYRANVDGDGRFRRKVRLRWYEPEEHARAAVLEFKERRALLNRKRSLALSGWPGGGAGLRAIESWLRAGLGEARHDPALDGVRPTLFNRYSRRYFASADGHFRATVDYDLAFKAAGSSAATPLRPLRGLSVLELKYAPEVASQSDAFGQALPLRSTRCSKYVTGVERELLAL